MNQIEVLETKMEMYKQSHQKIVSCKAKAELALWEYCKALYDMHQSKLYQAAGYANFEEYAEKEFGIKKTVAYEYLAYAKKRSEEFTLENGKIGITKLLLLNKLSEEEAEQFLKENDIVEISTKEVKRTIANYLDKKHEAISTGDTPSESNLIVEIENEIEISSFGTFLQYHRLNNGFSKRYFAKMLGMSLTTYIGIESDSRLIPKQQKDFLDKIIHFLNLTKEEIVQMYKELDRKYMKKGILAPDVTEWLLANNVFNGDLRKRFFKKVYKIDKI